MTLAGMELATRWYFHDITTTGDNGSYFAARWRAVVRTNRFGLREDEVSPRPAPGVFRIAFVGDSVTYGQGIEEEERLTERVARQLNEAHPGAFEVLNFGRAGADYERHFEILTLVLEQAAPDFILLQWLYNDLRDPEIRPPDPWRLAGPLHRYIQPRSALYYLAHTAFVQAQYALALLPPESAYYVEHFRDSNGPVADRARQRLEKVLDLAQDHDVPLGMILWPSVSNEGADFEAQDFLFAHVLAVCEHRRMVCLDLRPALTVEANDVSLHVNRFDGHPSAYANSLAAAAVFEAFEDVWLEAAERKPAIAPLSTARFRRQQRDAQTTGVVGRRRKRAVHATGRGERRGGASSTALPRSPVAWIACYSTDACKKIRRLRARS
jgi:lysophospholipase L1-like esterase